MPEFTPDDQPPVGRSTYAATAGAFASLDRAARREAVIKQYLYAARAVGESFEATVPGEDTIKLQATAIDRMARDLIEELHEIDRS